MPTARRPAGVSPRRPAWVSTVALVAGVTLLSVGAIFAAVLGPSGRVEATSRIPSPGVVVLDKNALRASASPVRVSASSAAGTVTAVRMLHDDAVAVLDGSRHTLIDGVSFLPRDLRETERRDGPLPRAFNADIFLAPPTTGERIDVEVAPSRLPQALVLFPGTIGEPRDDAVEVTMEWANAAWFWQAVALALVGLGLLTAGTLARRRRNRSAAVGDHRSEDDRGDQARDRRQAEPVPGSGDQTSDAPRPAAQEDTR